MAAGNESFSAPFAKKYSETIICIERGMEWESIVKGWFCLPQ